MLFGVMALGMLLPATMYAQGGNDNMFQVDDAFSGNRDITTTWVLINNGIGQSEAPLGSGLLILGAAGAGYVLAKRRHSRKGMTLVLALALMLGMTQCKKKDVETTTTGDLGKMVHITLNVGGGDRHIVYPGTGAVLYTDGDVIYVGDGSKYIGTLTYGSGAFSGDITEPAEGDGRHPILLTSPIRAAIFRCSHSAGQQALTRPLYPPTAACLRTSAHWLSLPSPKAPLTLLLCRICRQWQPSILRTLTTPLLQTARLAQ